MLERLSKYQAELDKAKKKRNEWDGKVKELERKCREEENTAIHDMVHAANMTPEQLAALLKMSARQRTEMMKPIEGENEDEENN